MAAAETNFIKKWILTKPAVLSAALFSGAEVVAYPPQSLSSGKALYEFLLKCVIIYHQFALLNPVCSYNNINYHITIKSYL